MAGSETTSSACRRARTAAGRAPPFRRRHASRSWSAGLPASRNARSTTVRPPRRQSRSGLRRRLRTPRPRRRLMERCGSRRCSAQEEMRWPSFADAASRQSTPHRHEPGRRPQPGAGPLQPERQVHGVAFLDRPWPGHEVRHAPDLRGDARRAGRGCLCRHCRFRHRSALHGEFRLARHPSRRQCGHGCGARGARRHDGSRGRGARSQRRRPRDRRARQYSREGRPAPVNFDQGCRYRRPVQAGQDDLGSRHLSCAAVGGRSGDRRDVARDLLRACMSRRRGRGRR